MKRLTAYIEIGKFKLQKVTAVKVASSWEELIDKCTITLPQRLKWKGKFVTDGSVFSIGDKVLVKLGYDGYNNTVFEGYLTKVNVETPLVLECEDALWHWKRLTFNQSFSSVSLATLLKNVNESSNETVNIDAVDMQLGSFRVKKANGIKVLQELKKSYGVYSWLRGDKLTSGRIYKDEYNTVKFRVGYNIISDKNLSYQKADDIKLKVTAISIMPDNSRIEVKLGDEDGDERTIYKYNLSESDLRKILIAEISRLKRDGFTGSFLAFGSPQVQHGDTIVLEDEKYAERNGKYKVKKVVTTFGGKGFRQQIFLDAKVG